MMVYMLEKENKNCAASAIYISWHRTVFLLLSYSRISCPIPCSRFQWHAENVLFVEHADFNIGGANVTTKAVGRLGDRPFAF